MVYTQFDHSQSATSCKIYLARHQRVLNSHQFAKAVLYADRCAVLKERAFIVCEHVISPADLAEFQKNLTSVVETVSSVTDIETWLKSQKYIKSVKLQDYLIKTDPPQKEFIVEFKMNDGSVESKAIDVSIGQKLELQGIHEW